MTGQLSNRSLSIFLTLLMLIACSGPVLAQLSDRALEEAARQTGLSKEELLRRYAESGNVDEGGELQPPGRQALPEDLLLIELPVDGEDNDKSLAEEDGAVLPPDEEIEPAEIPKGYFGADFFRLEPELFNPSTFGPVPPDYLIGVGDQIAVDVWGEIEFRIERYVDRDGSIILPRGGKVMCYNRTLADVEQAVRERLAVSYSGISLDATAGSTFLDVSLGNLRAIRVFVVGDATQPGAYELSSLSTIFTALYAAGGPAADGSMRNIRLVRDDKIVATLDIYDYLLHGHRAGDSILRDGDTVLVPGRGKTVSLDGAVRRPLLFELKDGEKLSDLITFAGGFESDAAMGFIHLERTLPPHERVAGQPDRVQVDIDMSNGDLELFDGDRIIVDRISDRLENWVEVVGNVKREGRYEYLPGMTARDLILAAGGLWGDTLEELAIVFRTSDAHEYSTLDFHLGRVMSGSEEPPALRIMDQLHVFSRWTVEERYSISINGSVREPGEFEYRDGMTLRDLILLAGGVLDAADAMMVEVSRLNVETLSSRNGSSPPKQTVDVIRVELGHNWLAPAENFPLMPRDEVAIRSLPWWENQRRVTLQGELTYPGQYSLTRPDEKLSEIIVRAGGLKPTADLNGARITRSLDDVGNIALDLNEALAKPGSKSDITLAQGDVITIPAISKTVKVIGVVGFPTSVIHEPGRGLGYYVDRAGGYAEGADKWKTRVVYPNGLSRPNNRFGGDPEVLPGSTIVVPLRMEEKGDGKLETLKEISAILASLATLWLVIDRTQ
ncbi:MAG: hypothetical protein GY835_15215 [bacterium]|nr:hypothetical protein [bacterium]